MESKTKVNLSRADIQRLVSHAFGDVPMLEVREMTDGWFNTAHHITWGDGQTVLKVGPPANADILTYEKDLLRAEVEAMRLVASDPAIPVPCISFADFSRIHLPYDCYFMDFVEGTTWFKLRESVSDEQNNTIEHQLGQITAHINAFEHPAFGYYAYGQEFDNWPDAFRWMCELLFEDARRFHIELDISEQEFFARFDENRAIFAEVTRPQLVHWDLWAGNIFVVFDDVTPRISGIVDFERALWGDPLMESYLLRTDGLGAYMAGYGDNILATPSQRLRRLFYNVYLYLIMIIEDGPRQYDDKGGVMWAQEQLQRDLARLRQGNVMAGD